jgi:signal transduction histidine kinase
LLISEIDLVAANFICETLSLAGFETRATDSQTEALAIYQEHRADLVFTNQYLAHGDGIALIKALKKIDPDFLGVMMTGVGNERIARDAILSGAFDYIIKDGRFYQNLPSLALGFLQKHKERIVRRKEEDQRLRLGAQEELAGWLDHNFKNILSATLGSLNLIDFSLASQSNEKKQEYILDSRESIISAMKLLDRLTAMTRPESPEGARNVLVSQVVDEAWKGIMDEVTRSPEESAILGPILGKVSFVNNTRSLIPQKAVYGDLFTIFQSLIKNALEALVGSDAPTIVIEASKDGSYLVCEVKDNGRGMEERVKRHAFEPLFSTKGLVGVGVSLAIVRSLVLRHLGEVECTSELGKGSTFKFTYFTE